MFGYTGRLLETKGTFCIRIQCHSQTGQRCLEWRSRKPLSKHPTFDLKSPSSTVKPLSPMLKSDPAMARRFEEVKMIESELEGWNLLKARASLY